MSPQLSTVSIQLVQKVISFKILESQNVGILSHKNSHLVQQHSAAASSSPEAASLLDQASPVVAASHRLPSGTAAAAGVSPVGTVDRHEASKGRLVVSQQILDDRDPWLKDGKRTISITSWLNILLGICSSHTILGLHYSVTPKLSRGKVQCGFPRHPRLKG